MQSVKLSWLFPASGAKTTNTLELTVSLLAPGFYSENVEKNNTFLVWGYWDLIFCVCFLFVCFVGAVLFFFYSTDLFFNLIIVIYFYLPHFLWRLLCRQNTLQGCQEKRESSTHIWMLWVFARCTSQGSCTQAKRDGKVAKAPETFIYKN